MEQTTFKELTTEEQKLLKKARRVLMNAYNPYSNFAVGAAVLSIDGKMFASTNMENAAYPACRCAEPNTISKANSVRRRELSTIAIIALGTEDITPPCGGCRQTIFESSQISQIDIVVIMSNTNMTKIVKATISELLPLAFGPSNLGIDLTRFRSKKS